VIVAGGSINSPQILMLSGIGPKNHLESFGIPVLIDNPAVGSNLNNHIFNYLLFKTNQLGRNEMHSLGTWTTYITNFIRYFLFGTGPFGQTPTEILGFAQSGLSSAPWSDIQFYFFNAFDVFGSNDLLSEALKAHPSGDENVFGLAIVLQHPVDLGYIRLQSANPLTHPAIEPRWFHSSSDVDIIVKGFRMWLDIINNSSHLKQFDIQFAEKSVPGCEQFQLLSDDYLKCSIRSRALECYHPVSTCRMGPKNENSVVDHELRVHGVDGLRVVDASVMPDQITGNLHAPVVMIAEKVADMIKSEWKTLGNDDL